MAFRLNLIYFPPTSTSTAVPYCLFEKKPLSPMTQFSTSTSISRRISSFTSTVSKGLRATLTRNFDLEILNVPYIVQKRQINVHIVPISTTAITISYLIFSYLIFCIVMHVWGWDKAWPQRSTVRHVVEEYIWKLLEKSTSRKVVPNYCSWWCIHAMHMISCLVAIHSILRLGGGHLQLGVSNGAIQLGVSKG